MKTITVPIQLNLRSDEYWDGTQVRRVDNSIPFIKKDIYSYNTHHYAILFWLAIVGGIIWGATKLLSLISIKIVGVISLFAFLLVLLIGFIYWSE